MLPFPIITPGRMTVFVPISARASILTGLISRSVSTFVLRYYYRWKTIHPAVCGIIGPIGESACTVAINSIWPIFPIGKCPKRWVYPDRAADGAKVAVSLFTNYGHGVATLTPTNVYLCPLLLVNLNVNFPVAGSSVPEKVPSSVFPPIMS